MSSPEDQIEQALRKLRVLCEEYDVPLVCLVHAEGLTPAGVVLLVPTPEGDELAMWEPPADSLPN